MNAPGFTEDMQRGLPPITPPVPPTDAEAQHEAENGLFAEDDECAS